MRDISAFIEYSTHHIAVFSDLIGNWYLRCIIQYNSLPYLYGLRLPVVGFEFKYNKIELHGIFLISDRHAFMAFKLKVG